MGVNPEQPKLKVFFHLVSTVHVKSTNNIEEE